MADELTQFGLEQKAGAHSLTTATLGNELPAHDATGTVFHA